MVRIRMKEKEKDKEEEKIRKEVKVLLNWKKGVENQAKKN